MAKLHPIETCIDGDNNNMTQYNPEDYWHKRGANYQATGEALEAVEVENLKKLINKFAIINSTFLEVGSGYGRIYNVLKSQWYISEVDDSWSKNDSYKNEIPIPGKYDVREIIPHSFCNYHMCDFVESMRYNCLRNTDILPDYWNGRTLPYPDNQFDFVISFSVFLHVPPVDIEAVFAEHVRICEKYFFIATYAGGLKRLAPHCFEHNYKKLFEKYDLKIVDEKFFQNGLRANWLLGMQE